MSTALKAHGLDGSLVEPDWAPMAMPEVGKLLKHFPQCGNPLEFVSVSPRPFSAAAVVSTQSGPVFLKRHHKSVRDCEGLLEEHRFLDHLRSHGVRVPRVLKSASGETAIAIGERVFEVHNVPVGIDLYGNALSWSPFRTGAQAYSAGQTLAKLHQGSAGFYAPARKPRPLVASFTIFAAQSPAAELQSYLSARPVLTQDSAVRTHATQALELLAPFHGELLPLLPALTPLWTHNDLHASNLLWTNAASNAEAAAIIDFGLSDRTNAIHDLAHAIERNIVEWLVLVDDPAHPDEVPVHFDHLSALLKGYESIQPLSHQEAAALAPMTALCHAEFALSEADYFLGVLHSPEKAAMAHNGWLVGHAQWFLSGAGKRLLNFLRQWAQSPRPQRAGSE
jgi:Ser/Thr protein kinase RdoA (MazF antagonist)